MNATADIQAPGLGEILVERGKLSRENLARASGVCQKSGEPLEAILVKLGMVSERDMAEAYAARYELPLVGPEDYPDVPVLDEDLVRPPFLKANHVLPLGLEDGRLVLAMADPTDDYTLAALGMASGREILPRVGVPSEIENAFERLYGSNRSAMGQIVESIGLQDELDDQADIEHLRDLASEAPVVRLVNLMLTRAVESRASDIHIEPFENRLKIRYRIDGVMIEVESPPARLSAAVISRIKIMAKLNIAERRLPQDGRIQLRVQGREIDLRVSTVPTMHGESVVMRILDKSGVVFDFEKLGFSGDTRERFLEVLSQPYGVILVTGPTGSGKSTTLYTALTRLNTAEVKILTVEDPVEYHLEGVNQIQVKPQIDLTFANALRAIVRQDPDIIMIGEIRDLETARIAVQSALTGHLVLSTLHTNDAAGGVTRLLDMGVEDYLLTSTVNGIVGQRLVRVLCRHCREPYTALPELIDELQLRRFSTEPDITLYRSVGCAECVGTGYRGRLAIVELLVMTDRIRQLVLKHADAGDIERAARAEGMY
ncbi:MAG: type II secretion system ATPase GspE, partial [Candidatus Competibacterales bacterium]|nr:type II secretion system ATPase GspE [Candidatus Competibacterales bacterium]